MNRPNLTAIVWAIAVVLVFALYACAPQSERAEYERLGAAVYQEHCAGCHGKTGRGDGPLAAELEKPTPDLTLLEVNFEGVFPAEYMLGTIDGRHEFLAHGTRMMPIWGNIWRPSPEGEEVSRADEIEAQRTMNGLLYYLQSIQRTE